jgi:hypothetical protein
VSLTARRVLTAPWLKDALWRKAQAVPSLDLRFADNKSLVDSVSGQNLITFTRASSATFIDSTGTLQTATTNAPRFDHNPTTGESLGLLVEEQRTNLLLQSENLGTTWTLNNATSSLDTAIAPNGQTAADAVIPTNGAIGIARQDLSLPDSIIYTFSIFFKTNGLNSLNLQFYNKANTFHGSKNLDLSTGVLSGTETIGVTSVVAFGNGWYRLILANLGSGTGATTPNVRIVTATTGNGTSGFYMWGAQLEAGAFATSYIPTTTAAATRAADVVSITGSAFSSWYRQDEGTVFVVFVRTYSGNFTNYPNIYQLNDGTDNNEITLFGVQNAQYFQPSIRVSATAQLDFVSSMSNVPGPNRYAHGFAVNSSTFAGNGTITATDTSVSLPAVNRLTFGVRSGQQFTGCYRRFTYFPARLPNTTLQRITQ